MKKSYKFTCTKVELTLLHFNGTKLDIFFFFFCSSKLCLPHSYYFSFIFFTLNFFHRIIFRLVHMSRSVHSWVLAKGGFTSRAVSLGNVHLSFCFNLQLLEFSFHYFDDCIPYVRIPPLHGRKYTRKLCFLCTFSIYTLAIWMPI